MIGRLLQRSRLRFLLKTFVSVIFIKNVIISWLVLRCTRPCAFWLHEGNVAAAKTPLTNDGSL